MGYSTITLLSLLSVPDPADACEKLAQYHTQLPGHWTPCPLCPFSFGVNRLPYAQHQFPSGDLTPDLTGNSDRQWNCRPPAQNDRQLALYINPQTHFTRVRRSKRYRPARPEVPSIWRCFTFSPPPPLAAVLTSGHGLRATRNCHVLVGHLSIHEALAVHVFTHFPSRTSVYNGGCIKAGRSPCMVARP